MSFIPESLNQLFACIAVNDFSNMGQHGACLSALAEGLKDGAVNLAYSHPYTAAALTVAATLGAVATAKVSRDIYRKGFTPTFNAYKDTAKACGSAAWNLPGKCYQVVADRLSHKPKTA